MERIVSREFYQHREMERFRRGVSEPSSLNWNQLREIFLREGRIGFRRPCAREFRVMSESAIEAGNRLEMPVHVAAGLSFKLWLLLSVELALLAFLRCTPRTGIRIASGFARSFSARKM